MQLHFQAMSDPAIEQSNRASPATGLCWAMDQLISKKNIEMVPCIVQYNQRGGNFSKALIVQPEYQWRFGGGRWPWVQGVAGSPAGPTRRLSYRRKARLRDKSTLCIQYQESNGG